MAERWLGLECCKVCLDAPRKITLLEHKAAVAAVAAVAVFFFEHSVLPKSTPEPRNAMPQDVESVLVRGF